MRLSPPQPRPRGSWEHSYEPDEALLFYLAVSLTPDSRGAIFALIRTMWVGTVSIISYISVSRGTRTLVETVRGEQASEWMHECVND